MMKKLPPPQHQYQHQYQHQHRSLPIHAAPAVDGAVALAPGRCGAAATLKFLVFTLGGEEYGVDIEQVQELRRYGPVRRLADVPRYVTGVVDLHGVFVTITDMRIKLDICEPSYDSSTVVVMVAVGGSVMGMVVDGVCDVVALTGAQIAAPPDLGSAPETDFLTGLASLDGRSLLLVDIAKLMFARGVDLREQLAA